MRPQQPSFFRSRWDLYAWALMGLYLFFQIMQWPLTPRFLDVYYHLSVMKGFDQAGGYVPWAFWEYAPQGRPHLYPPLLHILMLLAYRCGVPAMDVGRLIDCLSYPALILVFWRVVRRFQGERVAFFALLIISSSYSALLASITLSAFNLAAVFLLLGIDRSERGRVRQATACLALCYYAHTLMGWIFVLYLAARAVQGVPLRRSAAIVAGGLLLASPLLVHQWFHRDSFGFVKVKESSFLEWDLGIYVLGLWRALGSLASSKNRSRASIPLTLWLCFLPLVWTHPIRFWYGHGLLGLSWLAAEQLEGVLGRFRTLSAKVLTAAITALGLFFCLVSPILRWSAEPKRASLVWSDRTLVRYLWPDPYANFRSNGFTIYFPEQYDDLVRTIRENTKRGDILWSDFSYTAGILAILADRATSCAMLAEVRPPHRRNAIEDARMIVWFKDRDAKPREGMFRAAQRLNLHLVKESEMAFVYLNPSAVSTYGIRRALVPTYACFLLTALLLSAAFWDPGKRQLL